MASKIGSVTKRKKFSYLRQRDGDYCHYCPVKLDFDNPSEGSLKDYSGTLDHVVPQFLGGRNANFNLVLACNKCNHKLGHAEVKCECSFCVTAYQIFSSMALV